MLIVQGLIVKNYRSLSFILGSLALVLAFLVGYEQGKATKGNNIVLSCSDEILSSLEVPLDQIASKTNNNADETDKETKSSEEEVAGASTTAVPGKFVGSKNGTRYYKPDCGMVKRIKEENYIWFSDENDAKLQGYSEGKC